MCYRQHEHKHDRQHHFFIIKVEKVITTRVIDSDGTKTFYLY